MQCLNANRPGSREIGASLAECKKSIEQRRLEKRAITARLLNSDDVD
jgi:hypothetical protein